MHIIRNSVSLATLATALIPSFSYAAGTEQRGQDRQEIVVTGTLIRGAPQDDIAPVDTISSDMLSRQGNPSMVDLIKSLPVSTGVIGDSNQFDGRSQNNEGIGSINLRGLGPQRTLVLLNGRRIVPSSGVIIPTVDVNLIPAAALERIEILKDGAAATYGSDAIAGVVNFITRTGQDGFKLSGDYRYISGSAGDYSAAVSMGKTVDGAKFLLSAGYQHRSELRATHRAFAIQPYSSNPQGGWTGGGNPGNFDFNGRTGGLAFTADQGCAALGGFRSLAGSSLDRCYNHYGQFANLVEPEDRFQLFMDAAIDIADAIQFRTQASWGHTRTRITTSPSFLPTIPPSSSAAGGGEGVFQIPAYSPALRDYCGLYGQSSGCLTSPGGAIAAPALAFPVLFRPTLLGGNSLFQSANNARGSVLAPRTSDQMFVSAEISTKLSADMNFTTSVTYSAYDRSFYGADSFGDLLQNALSGFGGPTCAYSSTASRAGLTPGQLQALAGANGCTYYNPFSTAVAVNAVTGQANPGYAGTRNPVGFSVDPGAGLVNDRVTFDHFFQDIRTQTLTSQTVFDAILSGDSGIKLPGGSISFALGGQYRRTTYVRRYNAASNLAFYPCPGTPLDPAATCNQQTGALGFFGTNLNGTSNGSVWSGFAELRLPVAATLNLQLSARYENYGHNTGSTFDPHVRGKWQPLPWLAIRGGWGTTFRGPPSQNLAGNITSLQIIGSSFRAVDVNGNPSLRPENATTYGGGVTVRTGGFNASVDYFNYKLKGPIESEPVQGMLNALFGASGAANCGNAAYAALQNRFTFTGAGCNIANVQRLRTQYVNSADVSTSGIDFQASYQIPFDNGSVTAGFSGTYVIDYKTNDVVVEGITVQPAYDAVGLLNYQTTAYPLPQWKGNAYLQGDFGVHALRLQVNYIDGYTDQRGAAIFGPNVGALAGAAVAAGKEIKPFTTVDATYRLAFKTGTVVSLSALNIFDKAPPFARLDQNYDPFTASPLGFTVKIGIAQDF